MSTLPITVKGTSSEQGSAILKYMLDNNDTDQNTAASVASGLDSIEDTLMDLYSRTDKNGSVTVNGKTFPGLEAAQAFYQEKYKKASRIYATFQEFRRNAHETIMSAIRNLRIS